MRNATSVCFLVAIACCSTTIDAAVVLTTGAGLAVDDIDRSLTFSSVVSGTNLSVYSESGVNVTVPNIAYVGPGYAGFSGGYHYPNNGANAPTRIVESADAVMYGIEFSLGSGFGSTTAPIHWEAYLNGSPVGSGSVELAKGLTIGFSDQLSGFDELRVGVYSNLATASSDPFGNKALNALALDNLSVDLTPIPEPASLSPRRRGRAAR